MLKIDTKFPLRTVATNFESTFTKNSYCKPVKPRHHQFDYAIAE